MDAAVIYRQNIQPLWNVVKKVRDDVGALMADKGEDLKYASQMVASELVENAVKYGIAIDADGERGIEVEAFVDDSGITLTVTNRAVSEEEIANATRHIDMINETKDPKELYVQRINELMEGQGQDGSCRLGLFRIAYEGEFDLRYDVKDSVITIRAHRKVPAP